MPDVAHRSEWSVEPMASRTITVHETPIPRSFTRKSSSKTPLSARGRRSSAAC